MSGVYEGGPSPLEGPGFAVQIELGNEAMLDRDDVSRALGDVADAIRGGCGPEGVVRDENGNRVGRWVLQLPEEGSHE